MDYRGQRVVYLPDNETFASAHQAAKDDQNEDVHYSPKHPEINGTRTFNMKKGLPNVQEMCGGVAYVIENENDQVAWNVSWLTDFFDAFLDTQKGKCFRNKGGKQLWAATKARLRGMPPGRLKSKEFFVALRSVGDATYHRFNEELATAIANAVWVDDGEKAVCTCMCGVVSDIWVYKEGEEPKVKEGKMVERSTRLQTAKRVMTDALYSIDAKTPKVLRGVRTTQAHQHRPSHHHRPSH